MQGAGSPRRCPRIICGRLHTRARRGTLLRMTDDKTYPWELRRPDLVLRDIAEREPFTTPRTLLARVDGPYEQQRVVGVTVLWEAPAEDEFERTLLTEQALQRLGFDRTDAPYRHWPKAVPIVIRPGSAWFGWDESEAILGLRYGSNRCDVLQGDVLTVTARGWMSWPDDLYGTDPRAQWVA